MNIKMPLAEKYLMLLNARNLQAEIALYVCQAQFKTTMKRFTRLKFVSLVNALHHAIRSHRVENNCFK